MIYVLDINRPNKVLFEVAVTFNTSHKQQIISGLQNICV